MPLPFFSSVDDDALFPVLNVVIVGYVCLIFLPRWRYTKSITLALVIFYSMIYFGLLFHRLVISNVPLPGKVKFDTLDSIVTLFSDRAVVFAGWDHYIAFDLFVSRYVVIDSQVRKISHFCVAPVIPIILMAGPAGLALYACVVVPLFGKGGGIEEPDNSDKKKKSK